MLSDMNGVAGEEGCVWKSRSRLLSLPFVRVCRSPACCPLVGVLISSPRWSFSHSDNSRKGGTDRLQLKPARPDLCKRPPVFRSGLSTHLQYIYVVFRRSPLSFEERHSLAKLVTVGERSYGAKRLHAHRHTRRSPVRVRARTRTPRTHAHTHTQTHSQSVLRTHTHKAH